MVSKAEESITDLLNKAEQKYSIGNSKASGPKYTDKLERFNVKTLEVD